MSESKSRVWSPVSEIWSRSYWFPFAPALDGSHLCHTGTLPKAAVLPKAERLSLLNDLQFMEQTLGGTYDNPNVVLWMIVMSRLKRCMASYEGQKVTVTSERGPEFQGRFAWVMHPEGGFDYVLLFDAPWATEGDFPRPYWALTIGETRDGYISVVSMEAKPKGFIWRRDVEISSAMDEYSGWWSHVKNRKKAIRDFLADARKVVGRDDVV